MSIIDPGVGHLITKGYSSMSMTDPGVGHFTTKDIHQ